MEGTYSVFVSEINEPSGSLTAGNYLNSYAHTDRKRDTNTALYEVNYSNFFVTLILNRIKVFVILTFPAENTGIVL